jgi:hypothetical protein
MDELDPQHELFAYMARTMIPIQLRTSVPICTRAIEFDHVRPIGTGCLFRVADHLFLVTADHVLKHFDGKTDDHLVVVNREHSLLFGVGGEVHGTVDVSDDVGILRIPAERLHYFEGLTFLTSMDVDCSRPALGERYSFCGYPEEFSVQTPGSPFFYNTVLADEAEGPLGDFDPTVNILLAMDEAQTRTPSGKMTKFPVSMRGISGCPVWRVTNGGTRPGWTAAESRIVGVQTGVYTNGSRRIIKVSSWTLVLHMIRQQYPALRRALDLTLG